MLVLTVHVLLASSYSSSELSKDCPSYPPTTTTLPRYNRKFVNQILPYVTFYAKNNSYHVKVLLNSNIWIQINLLIFKFVLWRLVSLTLIKWEKKKDFLFTANIWPLACNRAISFNCGQMRMTVETSKRYIK